MGASAPKLVSDLVERFERDRKVFLSGDYVLVSLNLRHMANEREERRIGQVNLREGCGLQRVKTPEEVLVYED